MPTAPGTVYFTDENAVRPVFDQDHQFVPGESVTLRHNGGIVPVSTGVQTSRTVEASELQAAAGVDVTHVHLATLKPVNEERLLAASPARTTSSVEEHSTTGGPGGLVAELVANRGGVRVARVGLADGWSELAPTSTS